MIKLQKDPQGKLRQHLQINSKALFSDVEVSLGGEDSAPDPHDLFDSSLAACTAITLTMYAKRRGMALESINVELERDASQEKNGHYGLTLSLEFIGDLSLDDREHLAAIIPKCPIHKLMSHAEIEITAKVHGLESSQA